MWLEREIHGRFNDMTLDSQNIPRFPNPQINKVPKLFVRSDDSHLKDTEQSAVSS